MSSSAGPAAIPDPQESLGGFVYCFKRLQVEIGGSDSWIVAKVGSTGGGKARGVVWHPSASRSGLLNRFKQGAAGVQPPPRIPRHGKLPEDVVLKDLLYYPDLCFTVWVEAASKPELEDKERFLRALLGTSCPGRFVSQCGYAFPTENVIVHRSVFDSLRQLYEDKQAGLAVQDLVAALPARWALKRGLRMRRPEGHEPQVDEEGVCVLEPAGV